MNMDNYYTSPEAFIALKSKNIFARGTCRTNRKMFPECVTFTKQEARTYGRGTVRMAACEQHGLIALGWTDGNPVHFLTSVDGADMTTVTRRIQQNKTVVRAPVAIKKFNKGMQAVDRFDQLMSLFSLADRHPFKKWFRKMAMALFDFGMTNCEIHFFMANPDLKRRQNHRADFRERLCKELEEFEWQRFENSTNAAVMQAMEVEPMAEDEVAIGSAVGGKCVPVGVKDADGKKRSYRGMSCQVCNWEGKSPVTKNVFYCNMHGIRACLSGHNSTSVYYDKDFGEKVESSTLDELAWMCPNKTYSCWKKAHDYYIKHKLWLADDKQAVGTTRGIRTSSELYILKDKWMVSKGLKEEPAMKGGRKKQRSTDMDSVQRTVARSCKKQRSRRQNNGGNVNGASLFENEEILPDSSEMTEV